MFKNMKIGTKIALGFAVLLALLAFVTVMGFTGLRQVGVKVTGMRAAKDASITILEARREEKNFIIRGGQDYVDKVGAAVKKLNAFSSALESSGLSAGQLLNVSAIRDGTKSYEAAFTEYVASQGKGEEAERHWKDVGEQAAAALGASNRQLGFEYLRTRLASAYFLEDRSEELWKTFETNLTAFMSAMSGWLASGKAGVEGQRLQATIEEYVSTGKAIRELFQQQAQLDAAMVDAGRLVIDSATKLETQLDSQLNSTSAFSVMLMLASAAGALVLGILLSVILTVGITRPLRRGVEFAQTVAGGDFSQQLGIKQRDEVGVLARALNGMSVKLRDMVATIQENASEVAAASEQISSGSQSMAEGAQSQASTLEETSASVEELSASIEQVSEHAQSQAAAVEQGSSSMTQVQKSVDDISRSLAEISALAAKSVENAHEGANAVRQVVEGITLISESSERIGGIVTVISDIADQTNLLALNASIEAARAGEHGRGFAVVADEVSKLADRSSTSTKEIEGLIRESVKNVTKGVEIAGSSQAAMEQIRGASQKVKEMIVELNDSMQQQVAAISEVAKALENVSEMSQSISAATEEQSANAKQVSKAVESVNELTQAAASSAEEMSASTEQLSGMAQALQGMTAQFKIESNGGGKDTTALVVADAGNGNGRQTLAKTEEIAAAINVHSHWFFHLQEAIKTGSSEFRPETVASDNVCEFGKWLHGKLATAMEGTPIFTEIKALHAHFHEHTARILALALQGKKAEASSLIGPESEYRQLSGKLVRKLTELRKMG